MKIASTKHAIFAFHVAILENKDNFEYPLGLQVSQLF